MKTVLFFILWTLSLGFPVLAAGTAKTSLILDKQGFPTCYDSGKETFFFFRDPLIHADTQVFSYISATDYRRVTHHQIESCTDAKYLKEFPAENLRPVLGQKIFPLRVQQSAQQIALGGRVFRDQQTAQEFYQSHPQIFAKDRPEVIGQLQENYGRSFTSELLSLWMDEIKDEYGSDCTPLIGSCDFYLCQERNNPCGLEGYNLGYGYKYCSASKFGLIERMSTSASKNWVLQVFSCLQKQSGIDSQQLSATPAGSRCESIRSQAMNAHPGCYVQAGFCDLPLSEKVKIVKTIKAELFSIDTVIQGHEVLKRCMK